MSDERGVVSLVVVVVMLALVVAAGMAYDGGEILRAKVQAQDEAAEAARAGAQALSPATRGGSAVVDPAGAAVAAQRYLARVGHAGAVSVNGVDVTVTVTFTQPTAILGLVGIDNAPVAETATVVATAGITGSGH